MQALPRITQSPTAPDFVADPYRFYDHVRALGDFVFWEDYGMAMATSHEAVKAVLTHPAMGREVPMVTRTSRPDHLRTYNRIDDHSLLRLEPPEHTRLRAVVVNALDDSLILQMAPTMSRICDDLIDAFPKNETLDLQNAFADKMPGIALTRLLGLPDDMHAEIQRWARDIDTMQHARKNRELEDTAERAATEFYKFMSAHLAARQRDGQSYDIVGRILDARIAEQALTADEIIALVLLFIQAGTEGTAYSIGNSLLRLAEHPERALALSPDQISATVDECIRIEPPLHIIGRYAQGDVSLLGQQFHRDDQIGCLLASACRDDAVWPDGNVFDPFRAPRANMAMGAGIHACVGESLARMMMKIALPALFSRCPNLRVVKDPTYANDYLFRRLEALEVQICAFRPAKS